MSLQQPEAPAASVEFEIVAGLPSSTELAAVTAVIASLTEELEDAQNSRGRIVSAWQRSQRSIRKPIAPGAGAWRSFSG